MNDPFVGQMRLILLCCTLLVPFASAQPLVIKRVTALSVVDVSELLLRCSNMRALSAFSVALILAGCNHAQPSVSDTRSAEAKAIWDGESNCGAPWAAKDTDKLVDGYTDDASVMVPGIATMTA
jgi:hypothetical protein